jgi:hypothetical protein
MTLTFVFPLADIVSRKKIIVVLIFNTGIGLWPPKASIISKTVLEWPTTKACFPLFSFRIVAAAVFKSVAV